MNKTFEKLLDEMKELHNKKAQDYAQEGNPYSNFERAAELSSWFNNPVDRVFAALISVKLARLAELRNTNKTPNNESVNDTTKDLTVYCGLWHSYVEDHPVKSDGRKLWEDKNAIPYPYTCGSCDKGFIDSIFNYATGPYGNPPHTTFHFCSAKCKDSWLESRKK
jgi:hypothetical protein